MNNQNRNDTDGMILVMFCIAGIIFFMVVLWYRFHIGITSSLISLRNIWNFPFLQVYVFLNNNLGIDLNILKLLLMPTIQICEPSNLVWPFNNCKQENFEDVKYIQLVIASLGWNIIFGLAALYIAIRGYLRISETHPYVRFAKKHTLDSFMQEQKVNEPHLRVYADFNLQDISQNEGPFMGMKTPREFAKEHGLVNSFDSREIKVTENGVTRSQKDKKEKVPTVDHDKLVQILRVQLGGLWVGVDHITDAEAILLAMYLPRACSIDPKMLDNEFKQIWANCQQLETEFWDIAAEDIIYGEQFRPIGHYDDGTCIYPDGKKDLSAYRIEYLKEEFIKPYIEHEVTKGLLEKHAYTRTFIISVVFTARKLGVMAPCQLRWLKFYDREMWALLTAIGRPSFFCENMGAISHYQAEVVAGEKIYIPHFDVAINGFVQQLQVYRYSKEALENLGAKEISLDVDEGIKATL